MLSGRPASDHVLDPSQIIRVGTIVSVALSEATCTVEVGDGEDESVETIEIKWGSIRAGDTIVWSPPTEGEQVLLYCPGGDIAQAIPFGAIYSNDFPAPGDSLRELVKFKDGAVFAYDPESHVLDITLPDGGTTNIISKGGVTIDASDGGVDITGDVRIDGDVDVQGKIDATGDVKGEGVSLAHHRHSGVTTGSGNTGQPL